MGRHRMGGDRCCKNGEYACCPVAPKHGDVLLHTPGSRNLATYNLQQASARSAMHHPFHCLTLFAPSTSVQVTVCAVSVDIRWPRPRTTTGTSNWAEGR